MKSDILRVTCCLLFGISPLLAQKPQDAGGTKFRTFGWMVTADDLYYDDHGHDTKIPVLDSARSVFFAAPKEKQIVFYRLVPGTKEKPDHEVAATVDITSAGRWPLLIFTSNPAAPKHYRVTAIADDLESFPFPTCRVINFTTAELLAKQGEEQTKIEPRGIGRLDPHLKATAATETRYTTITVNTAQGPRLVYSNNWAVRPTQRTLVLVFPQDGQLQVMRVLDDLSLYTEPTPR